MGSLRRAKLRRALDVSAPFRPDRNCDGRREHFTEARKKQKAGFPPAEESRPENQTPQITWDLTGRSISEVELQRRLHEPLRSGPHYLAKKCTANITVYGHWSEELSVIEGVES